MPSGSRVNRIVIVADRTCHILRIRTWKSSIFIVMGGPRPPKVDSKFVTWLSDQLSKLMRIFIYVVLPLDIRQLKGKVVEKIITFAVPSLHAIVLGKRSSDNDEVKRCWTNCAHIFNHQHFNFYHDKKLRT